MIDDVAHLEGSSWSAITIAQIQVAILLEDALLVMLLRGHSGGAPLRLGSPGSG